MTSPRDLFLGSLFQRACDDPRVILLSVDMGAPALDDWRETLPNQFIAAGISEQNAINVAAGLADSGMIPVVYFMAVWTSRCYEQIRYSCSMTRLPVTIAGNGVGLGYAPAGPAHEPTEDIAYMRCLPGLEVWSPSHEDQVEELARLTWDSPRLRYIRLERGMPPEWKQKLLPGCQPAVNPRGELEAARWLGETSPGSRVRIVSSGYMLDRALTVASKLQASGIAVGVIDLVSVRPFPTERMSELLEGSSLVVTLEEQFLSGGVGSAVAEFLADSRQATELLRLGLPDAYVFANGSREQLLDAAGLSVDCIVQEITARWISYQ